MGSGVMRETVERNLRSGTSEVIRTGFTYHGRAAVFDSDADWSRVSAAGLAREHRKLALGLQVRHRGLWFLRSTHWTPRRGGVLGTWRR